MSIWICKKNDIDIDTSFENFNNIEEGDLVYIYWDDSTSGGFTIQFLLEKIVDSFVQTINFESLLVDLPYTIFYKTKASNRLIQLSEQEKQFILNLPSNNQTPQDDVEETFNFKNFLYNLSHQEE